MARKPRDYRAEYLARNERAKQQGKRNYYSLRKEKERVKKFVGEYERLLGTTPTQIPVEIPVSRLDKIAMLKERGAEDALISDLMESAADRDSRFWQEWREAYDKTGAT